jgi:hypothetical protein
MKSTWFLPRLFVIAVLINYVWEIAQSPLYVGMENLSLVWWHCGLAAVGDGFLVLLTYAVGCVVSRQRDWFVQPTTTGYAVMLLTGLVISVSIEWLAVFIGNRWEYTARMPLIPLLGVGLVPVAQMLALPMLIFRIIAMCIAAPLLTEHFD